jgi:hypothetical protein
VQAQGVHGMKKISWSRWAVTNKLECLCQVHFPYKSNICE